MPTLIRRRNAESPMDMLWQMSREVDRLFNTPTRTVEAPISGYMPANVLETADSIQFEIELPGLSPEDIDLTVENNVLTVAAEREWKREEGKPEGEYHLFERRQGRFERSFALPQRVDSTRIQASCENGILTVVLPKVEEAKPRRIEIKVNAGPRQIESK